MNAPLIINDNNHFLVKKKTRLIILLYEDYESEYCGKAFTDLKEIREYFKDDVCFVYKNFPCTSNHPSAFLAALVAEASGLQKKFIEVHDTIFEHQSYLEYGLGGILRLIDKRYGVSMKQLMEDIETPNIKAKVNNDIKCGVQMGVKNTPAIFINNNIYNGAVKFKELSKTIRSNIKINSA
ncbi:MAG: DsbA family protein [Ferruginibacter sp.]